MQVPFEAWMFSLQWIGQPLHSKITILPYSSFMLLIIKAGNCLSHAEWRLEAKTVLKNWAQVAYTLSYSPFCLMSRREICLVGWEMKKFSRSSIVFLLLVLVLNATLSPFQPLTSSVQVILNLRPQSGPKFQSLNNVVIEWVIKWLELISWLFLPQL